MSQENVGIQDLFSKHGLRCTKQRRALYEALCATKAHPTADQLFRDVADQIPGMSRATVYNTLDALCEAGLARKILGTSAPGGNGSTRFDATTDEHMHVRCGKTGSLHDVPDDLGNKVMKSIPKKTLQQIESQLGFRINQVQIELIGEYDKQD